MKIFFLVFGFGLRFLYFWKKNEFKKENLKIMAFDEHVQIITWASKIFNSEHKHKHNHLFPILCNVWWCNIIVSQCQCNPSIYNSKKIPFSTEVMNIHWKRLWLNVCHWFISSRLTTRALTSRIFTYINALFRRFD